MPQKKKNKNKRRSPNKSNKNSPNRRSPNKKHGKSPNKQNGKSNNNKNNKNNKNPNQNQNKNNSSSSPQQQQKQQPKTPGEVLKDRGNIEFNNGNFVKAIEFYTKAINLESNNHTFYSNRSAAYTSCGKYKLALIDADQCIKLKPDWAKGYLRKGTVLFNQNKFDDASDLYKDALTKCNEKTAIKNASAKLENLVITKLNRSDKIVGGHHAQADKFRTLINWLIAGGAKFPKLYLKFYSPEYRAIHAMGRIEKDEDICYIPHDYIMTSDVAKQSEIGRTIISSSVELRSKHSYLASYLLSEREKGALSAWNVYITILPRKFETIPLFFTPEQRKWLIGSISLKKIDDRLESLRLEHTALCNSIPSFSRFSLSDFIWARLVVITRIFGLVINDIKTDGLVPMADMLNHRRPRETKWTYNQKKRGFLITSLKNIPENSEIFDSYGRKCNSRFFVNYGFSLEFNLDNEALMSFELMKNDPQFAIKARHLGFKNTTNTTKDFQIPKAYKEKKVKECFGFLRVLHAQGNEFLIISSTTSSNGSDSVNQSDIPPLSIRNETNVLTSLAVSATKSLNKFVNSLDHDNKLLADIENYPMYSNKRNAILMIRGEKQVLTHYINLMKICLSLFKMKFKDLRNKLRKDKKFKDQDSPLLQYINHVVVPLVQRSSN